MTQRPTARPCGAGPPLPGPRAARRLQSGLAGFLAGTGTGPWRKSTSACPAGPTTPPISSASWPTTCGWTIPAMAPDLQFSNAAREAEAHVERLVAAKRGGAGQAAGSAGAGGAEAHQAVCRAAGTAEIPHRRGTGRGAPAARRPSGPNSRRQAASPPPTTSSSSTSAEVRDRPRRGKQTVHARGGASAAKRTPGNWAAGTSRGCCSRTGRNLRHCRPPLPGRTPDPRDC